MAQRTGKKAAPKKAGANSTAAKKPAAKKAAPKKAAAKKAAAKSGASKQKKAGVSGYGTGSVDVVMSVDQVAREAASIAAVATARPAVAG